MPCLYSPPLVQQRGGAHCSSSLLHLITMQSIQQQCAMERPYLLASRHSQNRDLIILLALYYSLLCRLSCYLSEMVIRWSFGCLLEQLGCHGDGPQVPQRARSWRWRFRGQREARCGCWCWSRGDLPHVEFLLIGYVAYASAQQCATPSIQ